jgi:NAD(P)-dependent dehydrogenase (short-subunit alcohol dehydrogenase family)
MRFAGKVAIVTGGASGIGRATVELLAEEGAAVVISDINIRQADALATTLAESGKQVVSIPANAADPVSIEIAASETFLRFGRIDILINNAGIAHSASALDYPVWDKMLAINLSGPFHWSRAVAGLAMRDNGGSIINIASLAGLNAYAGDIGYISAKHGLIGLTKALAIEWARFSIRVNCVCPGLTETPILAEVRKLDPSRFDDLDKSAPLGRIIQSVEQANAIAFFASDAASAITGAILPVDGGLNASLAGQKPPKID